MPAFIKEATSCIPNFKGIKFTSNDLSEAAQILRTLKEDQEIFLGADTLLAPAALLGIKSSIGTIYNLFPRLPQEIYDAVNSNDVPKARALQEKLSLAIEAHVAEGATMLQTLQSCWAHIPREKVTRFGRIQADSETRQLEAAKYTGAWVPIMKAGMEIVTGIKVGPPSLPQRRLSDEGKQRIQRKLKSFALI